MTRNRKLLFGGIALAALSAGGIAAAAHRGGFGHHGGAGMGMMGGPMMGAICSGNGAEMADHMLLRIEYKVKPTDAQKPLFDDVKAAAKAAVEKAKAGCPAAPAKNADGTPVTPRTPVDRLGNMETALAAQLDAVKSLKPAVTKFYAALTDEQKKAFSVREHGMGGMGRGGEEGRGGGMRHHGGRGMDGGPKDGTPANPQATPNKT